VRIYPIREIRVPSPTADPLRTQTGAGTALPYTPARLGQAFRADRRYCTAPELNNYNLIQTLTTPAPVMLPAKEAKYERRTYISKNKLHSTHDTV